MKKLVLAFITSLFAFGAFSQNIQLHYDMGKTRQMFTSTVEMFRPDKTGNTFFFIDMDYGGNDVTKGPSLAYFEIARSFNLGKSPFSFHVEYNGGLYQNHVAGTVAPNRQYFSQPISNAWLTGFDYSWNAKDFSKGITFQALYKNIANTNDSKPNNFQLTAVWYLDFAKGKLRFDGFADFWREGHDVSSDGFKTFKSKKFIFLTEPQLWYNCTKKFAVGSEIEMSTNFGGHEGFMINPTAALKYTF